MEKFQDILTKVRTELFDDTTFYLAVAFTEKNRRTEVEHDVFDSFYDMVYWSDDKEACSNILVHDYLYELLEQDDKNMKDEDAFENQAVAASHGYFWFEDLDKYLKLNSF